MEFTIPGAPIGKARPVITKNGAFTPKKTASYENLVKLAYPGGITENAVEVSIRAFYQVPKSKSKSQRERMLAGGVWPMKKPDCDNIAKVILDALNGIAYLDDRQVVRLSVEKRYSANPRVEVCLREAKAYENS